jgi:hypothetical protein
MLRDDHIRGLSLAEMVSNAFALESLLRRLLRPSRSVGK